MRGTQVDGARFRSIRRARGLTQYELALQAGVGERTVRNAEAGRRVRFDFLEFLATALGVGANDLVPDLDELRVARKEAERAERVVTAITAFARDRDLNEFRQLTDDGRYRLFTPGPAELPFTGEQRGLDGIRRIMDIAMETVVYERPVTVSEIRSSGNFVILSGIDHIRSVATGIAAAAWWHHLYEFDSEKVVRTDCLTDIESQCAVFLPRVKSSSKKR